VEGRPLVESELIARAQRGDVDAYGRLVTDYSDIAFRTAYVLCGSAADAEDAAQEAFFKAYRALDRFRRDDPFRPWLLRIVANEARNRRRSRRRHAGRDIELTPELLLRDPARSPEETVEAAEERATLLHAVQSLGPEDREVITCRYLLDLSTEETAAALGCRQGTVKSRLSRALERLRSQMEHADA
jgi:RNA polymerase sigma factor (sigma-70 family)